MQASNSPTLQWKKRLGGAGFYLLALLAMLPFVLPFIWMILNSLKNEVDSIAIPPVIFFNPVWENYDTVLFKSDFAAHFINSLIIGLGAAGFGLLFGVPAAYSIAQYRQHRLSTAILLTR